VRSARVLRRLPARRLRATLVSPLALRVLLASWLTALPFASIAGGGPIRALLARQANGAAVGKPVTAFGHDTLSDIQA
jgi:hypothetical protein